jgi:branched-chain amino acid transport system ATP-binding protein
MTAPASAAAASPAAGAVPALETRRLSKAFRGLVAVNGVDFRLEPGARHALIGPNGAGKTTLVNLITGHLPAGGGSLFLHGADITRLPEHRRIKRGLARTFQINQLFRRLTVLENVLAAVAERTGAARDAWRPLAGHSALLDEAYAVLQAVELHPDALKAVHELPYGRQRVLEIAIALALRPRVLLLDEPAAGVPAAESRHVLDVVASLTGDIAVLIIEHDMRVVFRFARRVTVMMNGSILREGTPEEIAADAQVRAVYLGESGDGHAR